MEAATRAAMEREFWGTPPSTPRGDMKMLHGEQQLIKAGFLPVAMQSRKPVLRNLLDVSEVGEWSEVERPCEAWQVARMEQGIINFEKRSAARRQRRVLKEWRETLSSFVSNDSRGHTSHVTNDTSMQVDIHEPEAACAPGFHSSTGLKEPMTSPTEAMCDAALSAVNCSTRAQHIYDGNSADITPRPPPLDHPPIIISPRKMHHAVALSAAGSSALRTGGQPLPYEDPSSPSTGCIKSIDGNTIENGTKFFVSQKSKLFAVSHRQSRSDQENSYGNCAQDSKNIGMETTVFNGQLCVAGQQSIPEHPHGTIPSSPKPKQSSTVSNKPVSHVVEVPVQVVKQKLPVTVEVVGHRGPCPALRQGVNKVPHRSSNNIQPLTMQAGLGTHILTTVLMPTSNQL